MSAYSKIFLIGHESKDGLEDLYVEIWQCEGEQRWFEAKYDEEKLSRLGNIKSVIPVDRDDSNAVIDACIAFAPKLFEQCPALIMVKEELGDTNMLDFSKNIHIPKCWEKLREEAKEQFKNIHIYEANIKRYKKINYTSERYLEV